MFYSKDLLKLALDLLRKLISTPSFSTEEHKTLIVLQEFFKHLSIRYEIIKNNIWAKNKYYNPILPTLLLNSHHDTVKPNNSYTKNPFEPIIMEEKLYGLGSNDAGGCLVSLLTCFLHFYNQINLPINIVILLSAEEEISGTNGVELALQHTPNFVCGVVGEPTQMKMAIAEKGLMVLDVLAVGKSGHAARNEGENAIYKLLPDLMWFSQFQFPKVSPLLGINKMTVTSINTENKQHNVIPNLCTSIVDIRINELYTFEEVLTEINKHTSCSIKPRSLRLKSTYIPLSHPLVKAGLNSGFSYYGSPTTSDKALMPFPTIKLGPGDSARSHIADEFIFIQEIAEGIDKYILLINNFCQLII